MALNQKRGLVGGAAGEPEDSFSNPFVHNGIKATNLQRKNKYGLRLLPGFDMNLDSASDEFKMSVIPYRDADSKPNQETGQPEFTGWYFIVRGYRFIGHEKLGFLSPLNLEHRDKLGVDPLFDMYRTAKNSNNPDWKFLTEKPKDIADGYGAPLPYLSQHVMANALVNVDGVLENRIVIFGIAGLKMLKSHLDILRPAAETTIIDPNWPDYLYGDVTSLDYGLWAEVKETKYNDAATAACFHFSTQRDRLVNHTPFPIDISTEDGAAALRGRYNISDTDRVTKIWTGEEILDFIVRDGFYPYELIQQACGRTWDVPPESTHPTHSTAPAAPAPKPAAGLRAPGAAPAARPAAPAPAAARPPVTPAAAPAAPARPPVAPAARPAPSAPVRPAPATAAPKPPGSMTPPSNVPRPPGAPKPPGAALAAASRPPVKPAAKVAPPAPPVDPDPLPEDVQPVATEGEPAAEAPAWTDEDEAAFQDLETRFMADSNTLTQEEMGRYAELGDRRAAASVQQ